MGWMKHNPRFALVINGRHRGLILRPARIVASAGAEFIDSNPTNTKISSQLRDPPPPLLGGGVTLMDTVAVFEGVPKLSSTEY
jgi:hypothetical protein